MVLLRWGQRPPPRAVSMVNEGVSGLSCDPIRVHRYLLAVSLKSECLGGEFVGAQRGLGNLILQFNVSLDIAGNHRGLLAHSVSCSAIVGASTPRRLVQSLYPSQQVAKGHGYSITWAVRSGGGAASQKIIAWVTKSAGTARIGM
jgi:hypothetical protein